MKKRSLLFLIIATLASLILCGCGTPLYDLTDEEEEKIIHGAAHVVSKYNIRMTDGMNWVELPEESEQPNVNSETEITTEKEETGNSDNQKPGDKTDGSTDKADKYVQASLEEAIGYSGKLSFKYTGMETKADVIRNGTMAAADKGNKLVVVSFEMKNVSGGTLNVNLINSKIGYSICLKQDGFSSMKANYFSLDTYEGTLEKNQVEKVILIFEAKESDTEGIVRPFLKVTRSDTSYSVKL